MIQISWSIGHPAPGFSPIVVVFGAFRIVLFRYVNDPFSIAEFKSNRIESLAAIYKNQLKAFKAIYLAIFQFFIRTNNGE